MFYLTNQTLIYITLTAVKKKKEKGKTCLKRLINLKAKLRLNF